MADNSKIEWTDATWNESVRGCTHKSAGCANCYAEAVAWRHVLMCKARGVECPYEGTVELVNGRPRWTGKLKFGLDVTQPLRWKRPRRIFVDSMSDLFHEDVPEAVLDAAYTTMELASHHTYQILTKRAGRMHDYLHRRYGRHGKVAPRQIWHGVSCEDQTTADERIPWLQQCASEVRFLSLEPLLGEIRLVSDVDGSSFLTCDHPSSSGVVMDDSAKGWRCDGCGVQFGGSDSIPRPKRRAVIHWVIVGGESGAKARPCDIGHIEGIIADIKLSECDIPVFVKQVGAKPMRRCALCGEYAGAGAANGWALKACSPEHRQLIVDMLLIRDRKGGNPDEWPKGIRIREYPL